MESFSPAAEDSASELRPGMFGVDIAGHSMSAVRWRLVAGSGPTPLHRHAEFEQFGIVVEGSIRLEIDGESRRLGPGDVYWVEAGRIHGRLEVDGAGDALIVDVFTPSRTNHAAVEIVDPS